MKIKFADDRSLRVFNSLSKFQQEFTEQWAYKARLHTDMNGHSVYMDKKYGLTFTPWDEFYDELDPEFEGVDGFGYDNLVYRLIEYDTYIHWYGWIYNSHGSTQVHRMNKEDFISSVSCFAEQMEKIPDSPRPDDQKHLTYEEQCQPGGCFHRLHEYDRLFKDVEAKSVTDGIASRN